MDDIHSVTRFAAAAMLSLWTIITAGDPATAQSNAELNRRYVPSQLFPGTLYVGTAAQLSDRQWELLAADLAGTPGGKADQLLVIGRDAGADETSCVHRLRSHAWTSEPVMVPDPTQDWRQIMDQLSKLESGDCVWLNHEDLTQLEPTHSQQVGKILRQCVLRGATVCIDAHASEQSAWVQLSEAAQLLPDIRLSLAPKAIASESADATESGTAQVATGPTERSQVVLSMPAATWLRIHQREAVNLSDAGSDDCQLAWPATEHYAQVDSKPLPARSVCDLVAARRALMEREMAEFPSGARAESTLNAGSLVIVGGGGASPEIWRRFIDLAGGKEARIVVLPTAVPDPKESDAGEARILRRLGAEQLRILPQIEREQVSSDSYLENLRWATGVWFGGGRQWRFVDAYWGTPAWDEFKQVLARGGVIGGSSAGATIQGDLLVRGHPLGNQIMVADGYRRGLALLPGVAIDQHFRQRNRFDDLAGVMKRFPSVLGIGIDEGTALVIQAPGNCEVLGEGSVWFSVPGQRERSSFLEKVAGSQFEWPIQPD